MIKDYLDDLPEPHRSICKMQKTVNLDHVPQSIREAIYSISWAYGESRAEKEDSFHYFNKLQQYAEWHGKDLDDLFVPECLTTKVKMKAIINEA